MLQSKLFTKTLKTTPKDEVSDSSKFLIRAGYIDKLMAGVYSYLPLGFLVLKRIENIIREEMKNLGAQEILLPSLNPKDLWVKTGRWESFSELYKLKDLSQKEFALAATHEEVITPLVKKFVNSYKDLPFSVFQIQNKFRSELRVKSGLIRGREFIMKDLYSFHKDLKDLENFYEKSIEAYNKIFKRVNIDKETRLTLSSGGTFSKFSHEFQTISDIGEDTVHICTNCNLGINKEIINEQKNCSVCKKKEFIVKRSIEVGNIFKLCDKYSKPFELTYQDKNSKAQTVLMGCYGIGLGRLLSTIVEINHDQDGIIWPKQVTPFQAHLIDLDNEKITSKLYEKLTKAGITVLYDERDVNAGAKLKDADLIGISIRLVSSAKTKENLEIKYRHKKDIKVSDYQTTLKEINKFYA